MRKASGMARSSTAGGWLRPCLAWSDTQSIVIFTGNKGGGESLNESRDECGDTSRAPHVLAFDPSRGCSLVSSARSHPPPAHPRRTPDGPPRTDGPWPSSASVSQTARLSSRCIRSGVASPVCSAIVHAFLRGKSLINHQPGDVLAGLAKRLYHDGSGHLKIVLPSQLDDRQGGRARYTLTSRGHDLLLRSY